MLSRILAPVKPVMWFFLAGLLLLSTARLGLSLWQFDAVTEAHGWSVVLLQGLRVDVATLCLMFGLPAVVLLLLPAWRPVHAIASLWLASCLALLLLLELATPGFMGEYGLRPNRLFIEYLAYPREVLSTLWNGRPWQLVLAPIVAAAALGSGWTRAWRLFARPQPAAPWIQRAVCAVLVLLLSALGARSTLGHRPLNPAMVAFSANPLVNQLPLNSFYALANATRQWLKQEDSAMDLYGPLPEKDVVAAVRATSGLPDIAFTNPDIPTLAARVPTYSGKPRNLVIVLEESLGAQFIGHLGGLPLSPNLDRLSERAWTFTQMYATGTRSVRGIEAVVAGFAPTPAQAVVKQPKAQQGFYTLAQTLKARGYDTTFYYGGQSHFDNMRGFFFGNGFDRMIDQKDYAAPQFTGSWGVSDEDLFDRADEEFDRLHAAGTPFFSLVFSSSNHDPFEFPDGRIGLYEQPKQTRNNAAKYADHAVGQFFKQAMASDYWSDTVFLVVADHDSRVFGEDLVPVDNFHVPALILGAGIAPRRDERIASQIDLGPTLLSLIGIGDATPMTGRDLSDTTLREPGRALMQYDGNYAWMQGEDVVVLQPQKNPQQYRYDLNSKRLRSAPLDPTLARTAHAQALWGSLAYDRRWYRTPEPSPFKN
ncbi:MAG: sulfatase [Lysobacterales bacterium RIFOXYD1_FULL_69_11]|nr:MAG: sulfatase [Xanthomonadales bacterium RIFOXYA1_FULL_69_10]OHE86381.1 MAG: sulfatase [Xanthomonadales bacterium RIFOXYD1_FULL_69_11]